jgi:PAB1-binding protein PBP1
MDARSEFFVYMGAALGTIAALFVGQIWYASYIDVAVVHAPNTDAPMDGKLEAVRAQEQARLEGGAVSIEKAMAAIAKQGRSASPKLASQPSEDLSAMSGWAHTPGFKAYVPRAPQAVAPAPAPEGVEGAVDGGVPLEGAEAAPVAVPARPKIVVGYAKPEKPKPEKPQPEQPAAAKKVVP